MNEQRKPVSFRSHQYFPVAVFLVALVVVVRTGVDSLSLFRDVNTWLIYSITAIGFYWVFSLGGRFAFCHTFMMALGAYTTAFVERQGLSPWISMVGGMAAAGVVALVVGLAVRKASVFYFAIATLALTEVGAVVFKRATSFTGPSGVVSDFSPLSVGSLQLLDDRDLFLVLVGMLGVILVLAVWIDRSPLRRRLIAAAENPLVARSAGIDVGLLQLLFFALGSSIGGLGGSLVGAATGTISTESFGIDLAVGIFLMVVLGGLGSHWGAVVGAAFYVGLPRVLSGAAEYSGIVYSAVLLIAIIVLPDGIIGTAQRRIANWGVDSGRSWLIVGVRQRIGQLLGRSR